MLDERAAVDGVLAYIHKHIDEPLSLAKIARYAAYSPFHFSRMFKARVGIALQQYVASLRLHRAKELLLTTDLSVREIGLEIGQQSLGTFTTRFSEKVGVSPARFRASAARVHADLRSLLSVDLCGVRPMNAAPGWARPLTGTVSAEGPFEGIILLGLFATPIAEGVPLHSTMLYSPGDFCIPHVPPGTYYLVGTAIASGMEAREILLPRGSLRVSAKEPVVVKPHLPPPHVEATLAPPQPGDPPLLISIPFLMERFLRAVAPESVMEEPGASTRRSD